MTRAATRSSGGDGLEVLVTVAAMVALGWLAYAQIAPRLMSVATPATTVDGDTAGTATIAGTLPSGGSTLWNTAAALATAAGVIPDYVLAMVNQESGWNPNARSSAGALGLMQLMPATAAQYGATNPLDPVQNLTAGIAFFASLVNRYGGNYDQALAAYNAGPGTVDKGIAANPADWLSGMSAYQSLSNHVQTVGYIDSIDFMVMTGLF